MEVPLEDWRWIVDINFMGVVHGARAAIPHLQRNGAGLLINVASAAAFASAPGMISYNATKAAVLSLSETLSGELASTGTQVSVVMPTYFQTSLLESFRGPPSAREQATQLMQGSELRGDGSRARCAAASGRWPALHRAARLRAHVVAAEALGAAVLSQACAGAAGKDEGCPGESTASMKRV